MDYSEWSVSWKPSWTVQATCSPAHPAAGQPRALPQPPPPSLPSPAPCLEPPPTPACLRPPGQVAIEGSHYIAFQLLLKISEVELSGRLKLSISADPAFSKISMSFLGAPKMSLKSECTVNWGATPLPIQEYITSAIDDFFKTYVRDTMVAPNAYTLEPPSFQPKKGLTDEDVRCALPPPPPPPARLLSPPPLRAPSPPSPRPLSLPPLAASLPPRAPTGRARGAGGGDREVIKRRARGLLSSAAAAVHALLPRASTMANAPATHTQHKA